MSRCGLFVFFGNSERASMSVHASTKALRLESESNQYSSINHDSLSRYCCHPL